MIMKKIVCITLALFVMVSVFLLPVYADGDTYTEDGQENLVRAIAIISKYKKYKSGECTADEFRTFASQQTGKSYYDTAVDRTLVVQILTDYGVDVDYYVNKFLDDTYGDNYRPNVDYNFYIYGYNPIMHWYVHYDFNCNIDKPSFDVRLDGFGNELFTVNYKNNGVTGVATYYKSDGSIKKINIVGDFSIYLVDINFNCYYLTQTNVQPYLNWGDLQKPDNLDIPIITGPDNIDDMTDEDFNNFLDDLLGELNKLKVDLNSMLSILQAILNQIASINGKMVTQSQFNSGIHQIISAINALQEKELTEEEQEQQLKQQIEKQETIDTELFVPKDSIDEKLLNLKDLWLSKFSFINQFKDCFELIKYNDCDNVSIDMSLYGQTASIDLSMFDNIRDVVRVIIAAFIYFSYAVRQFKRMPVIIGGGGDEL